MIEWCILVYFLLSFIVMNLVQPQRDTEHPVAMTFACFLIGGLIFVFAIMLGFFELVTGKELW